MLTFVLGHIMQGALELKTKLTRHGIVLAGTAIGSGISQIYYCLLDGMPLSDRLKSWPGIHGIDHKTCLN